MQTFQRALIKRIKKAFKPNKVVLIFGARRIGKTWLLKTLINDLKEPYILLNGEDAYTTELLSVRSIANYKRLMGKVKVLIIDEAQKIKDIGWILKLMVDELDGIKIIATGSAAFDLANKMGEPLTGRKSSFQMFPLAQMEYAEFENYHQTLSNLEERLVFGSYPEISHLESNSEKEDYLRDLMNSYLLKDILEYEGIRNSSKLYDLLRLIAFQIGKEVSNDELGRNLGMSKNTVERYLDLLSKVFVIFKVQGFSRNLRKEIVKNSRWYFYDNGIRNALIANFNPIKLRNDIGDLWENYLISERVKWQNYNGINSNNFFWRTYQQQEIDWIEERGDKLYAFEIKWSKSRKKIPSAWANAYPDSEFAQINRDNYLDFINT